MVSGSVEEKKPALTPCMWKGWGPPGARAVAGKVISIDEWDGRE